MSDDCAALLEHLNIPSAALLGHSMGGFTALDCAIRHPELVSRLILAGTSAVNSETNNARFRKWAAARSGGMDAERWFMEIFRWIFSERFFQNPEAVKEAVRFAVEYSHPQSAAAFANQVRAIEAFDGTAGLPGIRAKTLVLCGNDDRLFPPAESEQALRAIPGAEFVRIENAAHSIHLENPQAFTEHVLEFLGRR